MPTTEPKPTVSVLINLFNYEQFITDAIQSVLDQTYAPTEIIVVDDGSTDGGSDQVEALQATAPTLRLIRQSNQGQLACIQRAVSESTGEILFFLDADDLWQPHHIETFLKVFQADTSVDLVFCGYDKFGQSSEQHRPYPQDIHLGQNVIATLFNRSYFGSITSANAMRRKAVEPLFPAPEEMLKLCRMNGDAWLVLGNALYGGTAYYIHSDSVRYRIHGENGYHRAKEDKIPRFNDILSIRRIIEYFRERVRIPREIRFDFHREFQTIRHPDKRSYRKAISTLRTLGLPLPIRIRMGIRLRAHYRKNRCD